jgi:hypothetical protein
MKTLSRLINTVTSTTYAIETEVGVILHTDHFNDKGKVIDSETIFKENGNHVTDDTLILKILNFIDENE